MADRPIPYNAVYIAGMEWYTSIPGSVDLVGEDGRRNFASPGIEQGKGTVTIAPRRDASLTDAQRLQNEAAFEAWHRSLRGNDNQASLSRFGGLYSEGAGEERVTAAVRWTAISDEPAGGSRVNLSYTPTDADLSKVVVAGAPIVVLGRFTSITSVTTAPANGTAVVVVAQRLPAQGQVNEEQLSFDYTSYGGTFGMGAAEAVGGRLVIPLQGNGITSSLVFADIATGAPDLSDPIGSLLDDAGTTWFPFESNASGIAYLNDGRYFVCNHAAPALFVILGADGRIIRGQNLAAPTSRSAALIATSSTAVIPGRLGGAALLGGYVYVIDTQGRMHRISLANLTNPQAGAFTQTGARYNLDYVQAEPVGVRTSGDVAGMWVTDGQLRILRRTVGGRWQVERLTISGGTVTGTELYRPTVRPFTGATEIGGALYAAANNRIYKYTTPTSTAVQLGAATASFEANILAEGVSFPKTGPDSIPVVTYPFEEVIS